MKNNKQKDSLGSYFKRCQERTPPFFRKLRTLGLILVAAGTTVLTAPIEISTCLTNMSSYFVVAGAVAIAMSLAVVSEDSDYN